MLPAVSYVVVVFFLWGCAAGVSADDQGCYTSGSVAGIVIASIVVTLVSGGLALAFVWYLWKQRKGVCVNGKSQDKLISCPPMTPDKQLIVHEKNDYAFDNPYFKDDETDAPTSDTAEKGETGFHVDNGDITPAQNAKTSNGTTGQHKKNRPFSSLPFHVFHPSGKKQRATMDDTYISKHLERVTVPLRGHDFTGLGFNICGNMRDGIFVKDVLHRGPASESGKIKAGDRIIGVTVSFAAMVYEDALTILSYASPYDVRLEIEKSATADPLPPTHSPKRLGGTSTSFRTSDGRRRLFHPLYRSQSIDDLTQIGKEGFFLGNNSVSGSQRESGSSATPKRSQSVEATNGGPKARAALALTKPSVEDVATKMVITTNKGSRKSSTSSCESANKVTTVTVPEPVKTEQASPKEEKEACSKKEIKSSRFRVEQTLVKTEAPASQAKQIPPKPARDTSEDKPIPPSADDGVEKNAEIQEKKPNASPSETRIQMEPPVFAEENGDGEKPTAPPRKAGTPAKRRAPAPPPAPKTEAVIHRTDEQTSELTKVTPEPVLVEPDPPLPDPPAPPSSDIPDLPSSQPTSEPDIRSSDNSSLSSRGQDTSEPSSPGKRKASSLGDLTKLDPKTHKASTAAAILERAVSLDLQQSLPGENLIKQKKILRAPTFEVDYDENKEGDTNDAEVSPLKRWDAGLEEALIESTNSEIIKITETLNLEKVAADVSVLKDDIKEESKTLLNDITATFNSKMDGIVSDISNVSLPEKPDLETIDLDIGPLPDEIELLKSEISHEAQVTSTPARKLIEVKDFLKDDDDSMDDIPYLGSATPQYNGESTTVKHSITTRSSTVPNLSPVVISIPVIKPDLTHYEKLPSPPPASTHPGLDTSWRLSSKTTTNISPDSSPLEKKAPSKSSPEENGKSALERISVQSLYRPIFSNKESSVTDESAVSENNNNTQPEKLVNGNDSDSSEHYSTAQETTASSVENNSTLSVTLSSSTVGNNVAAKTPNNVAGFAKTLIIPSPNDVENLLNLAKEPNTPPPNLEPPPISVDND
ncbi:nascent polypeptide-associated complex subunit alpha, muscle-specific form-like [Uloborus diversus]|uniref:nascent polypeptide-associated complex subunit alpha, muscle-specific form-like n=1 Tax=Uloborus diversus TaxID=327109 RepID=UPI00240A3BF7|nr:nascent polypeptide-associated complex subunit alpha, muscle-specific form-like [Uloborus diversus]